MDRNALVFYLKELRDLEFTKARMNLIYKKEYQDYYNKKEHLEKPKMKDIPSIYTEYVHLMVLGALSLLALIVIVLMSRFDIDILKDLWKIEFFFLACGVAFTLPGIIQIVGCVKDRKSAKEWNEREQDRVNRSRDELSQLQKQWEARYSFWKNEYSKVNRFLNQYYGLNILPSQYRNIQSIYYIYEYMSTSHETLEATLIHEHMENGIQRILEKLDYIIDQNAEIICQNRISESNDRILIAQNSRLLKSAEQTTANTYMAAQNAEIAAYYSRVNAYYSMADYLR